MKSVRCQFNNISNHKKCKHRFILTPENKILHTYEWGFLCTFHMRYLKKLQILENNAIIIQRYYIGYRVRRKINNIFKKLPDDIQNIIIHKHIRKNYYIDKYNKSLQTILNNKISKYYNDYKDFLIMEEKEFILNILKNENNLMELSYLSGKYNDIIHIKYYNFVRNIIRNLGYAIRGHWQRPFEDAFTNDELMEIYNLYLNNQLIYEINTFEMLNDGLIYKELKTLHYIIENESNPENNAYK